MENGKGSKLQGTALTRCITLTAITTFVLVWVGGLVTSHGAGLAVPDWPNTYGYNMFFFPISKWMGGVFYEHTHRLVACAVGALTTIVAFWLYGAKCRRLLRWCGAVSFVVAALLGALLPERFYDAIVIGGVGLACFGASFFWPACTQAAKWQRYLGSVAFGVVVLQGVLGGLRVTELKNWLGIIHGTLAQLFFLHISALVLLRSRYWDTIPLRNQVDVGRFRMLFAATTVLVVVQLAIGATMRHQHAGLAIPDFPTAYGKLWPNTDEQSVLQYNQQRIEVDGYEPITAFQIWLQMVHRIVAGILFIAVLTCWRRTLRSHGAANRLTRWARFWFFIVLVQAVLGALTIWTNKSADIATLHVAFGALSLLVGGLLTIISFRVFTSTDSAQIITDRHYIGASGNLVAN